MSYKTWTEKELIEACKDSNCYADVLKKLGLVHAGGNHYTIKRYIEKLNIDISKWNYKAKRQLISRYKGSVEELLIKNDIPIRISSLRKRIIKENIIEYSCSICNINSWQDKNIALHLDHINGDFSDNRKENLRFLCPNCHSQTPTFGSKNSKRKFIKNIYLDNVCFDCGKAILSRSIRCRECDIKNRIIKYKISWPAPETILKMIKETNFLKVSKKLGVSDRAIRKHLKKMGFEVPSRKNN